TAQAWTRASSTASSSRWSPARRGARGSAWRSPGPSWRPTAARSPPPAGSAGGRRSACGSPAHDVLGSAAMQTEAMVLDRHGGPEVLERRTIELEPPGPCQVRVRVHAVAMNHMDLWVRRGGPAFKLQYPHRLGCDIAGVVEELGPGARGVAVGDRV